MGKINEDQGNNFIKSQFLSESNLYLNLKSIFDIKFIYWILIFSRNNE